MPYAGERPGFAGGLLLEGLKPGTPVDDDALLAEREVVIKEIRLSANAEPIATFDVWRKLVLPRVALGLVCVAVALAWSTASCFGSPRPSAQEILAVR